jgi:indolepyruvate ferredoxin oxidoreductase beta subunit
MSFEDTIRVADLKIRAARRERVRAEVAARADQLLYVFEFMKPRVEEICGTLPAPVGRWIANSTRLSRWLRRLTHGRRIGTSHVGGFLLLYSLACLRRYRRRTLRFSQEDMNIRAWLELVKQIAPHDCALAAEITECQTLVKGYGDTHERGLRAFGLITARARILLGQATAAERIRELRLAALADEEGHALQSASSLQEATL